MAPAIPWIVLGLTAASTAVSVASAFKTPKAPTMLTSTQDRSRESLQAAYAQAETLRQRRGASSTILTGPLGVTEPPQTIKATLGG